MLEVGCGAEGGLVPALVEAGYDAVGVDPEAPEGERFVRGTFQEPSCNLRLGWEAVVVDGVVPPALTVTVFVFSPPSEV